MRLNCGLRDEVAPMYYDNIIFHAKHCVDECQADKAQFGYAWNLVDPDYHDRIRGIVFTFERVRDARLRGIVNFTQIFTMVPWFEHAQCMSQEFQWPLLATHQEHKIFGPLNPMPT